MITQNQNSDLKQRIEKIQHDLKKREIDGWLVYDHHGSNRFMPPLLMIPPNLLLTRRFYVWIPKQGRVKKLVHAIEADLASFIPGDTHTYISKQDLERELEQLLEGSKTLAMEFSPKNDNPYLSLVDGGTIDLIRSFGKEVVSSGDLLLSFTSVLSNEQLDLHEKACEVVQQTCDKAFELIADHLKKNKPITEYRVQKFILSEFAAMGYLTEEKPICAVGVNSAYPHYTIDKHHCKEIHEGDFILIDLWCKKDHPFGVYADITRVGLAGSHVPEEIQKVFDVVLQAQEAGIAFIKQHLENKELVQGYRVDQVVRDVVEKAGYGEYFTHRTGHNIDQCLHGAGTHLDNLETPDHRLLLPRCCFSIEPGIYIPASFGVRLETDAYITEQFELKITAGMQKEIFTLL